LFLQELEAIKARVKEMEEEAEKIRQMQNEVEKQMNRSTTSTLSKCYVTWSHLCSMISLSTVLKCCQRCFKTVVAWLLVAYDFDCLNIEGCDKMWVANCICGSSLPVELWSFSFTILQYVLWSCNDVYNMLDSWLYVNTIFSLSKIYFCCTSRLNDL